MGRYKQEQRDTWVDRIPLPTTHTVVVTDKATGEEHKGSATTIKEAEQKAWDNVRKSGKD